MSRLIILSGPSGCGKSTYATHLSNLLWKNNEKSAIISTDFIRKTLFGDASIQLFPNKVFHTAFSQTTQYLLEGYTVIFDATSTSVKDRATLINIAKECNCNDIECHYFTTPIQLCIIRQEQRNRKVPTKVIERQFKKFVYPKYEEGFSRIREIDSQGLMKFEVCLENNDE